MIFAAGAYGRLALLLRDKMVIEGRRREPIRSDGAKSKRMSGSDAARASRVILL